MRGCRIMPRQSKVKSTNAKLKDNVDKSEGMVRQPRIAIEERGVSHRISQRKSLKIKQKRILTMANQAEKLQYDAVAKLSGEIRKVFPLGAVVNVPVIKAAADKVDARLVELNKIKYKSEEGRKAFDDFMGK